MRYPETWNQTSAYIAPKQKSAKIFLEQNRQRQRNKIEISIICLVPSFMFRIGIFQLFLKTLGFTRVKVGGRRRMWRFRIKQLGLQLFIFEIFCLKRAH